ncbi:MAG: hypothetical protein H6679_00050 [Epsilonproteobacteria bacterium]|nr:hypothetical protein [Campylobacterota bacterium]
MTMTRSLILLTSLLLFIPDAQSAEKRKSNKKDHPSVGATIKRKCILNGAPLLPNTSYQATPKEALNKAAHVLESLFSECPECTFSQYNRHPHTVVPSEANLVCTGCRIKFTKGDLVTLTARSIINNLSIRSNEPHGIYCQRCCEFRHTGLESVQHCILHYSPQDLVLLQEGKTIEYFVDLFNKTRKSICRHCMMQAYLLLQDFLTDIKNYGFIAILSESIAFCARGGNLSTYRPGIEHLLTIPGISSTITGLQNVVLNTPDLNCKDLSRKATHALLAMAITSSYVAAGFTIQKQKNPLPTPLTILVAFGLWLHQTMVQEDLNGELHKFCYAKIQLLLAITATFYLLGLGTLLS